MVSNNEIINVTKISDDLGFIASMYRYTTIDAKAHSIDCLELFTVTIVGQNNYYNIFISSKQSIFRLATLVIVLKNDKDDTQTFSETYSYEKFKILIENELNND